MKTTTLLTLGASFALATSASAANLIVNGDFGTGDFTGWSNTTSGGGTAFAVTSGAALSAVSNTMPAFAGATLSQSFAAQTDFAFSATIAQVALGNGGSRRDLNLSVGGLIFKVDAGGIFINTTGSWVSVLDDSSAVFTSAAGTYDWAITATGFDGTNSESLDIILSQGGSAVFTATNRTGIADTTGAVSDVDFSMGSNWGTSQYSVDNVSVTVVPEPSSAALLGLGGLALILRRRK